MANVIVFHHAGGLTSGVRHFADQLRAAGHRVTVPDLYEGASFDNLSDGVAHAQRVGFATIIERGRAAAADLPAEMVYAGFSLGVLPAQALAQTWPGAVGALLFHSCVPAEQFGCPWPPALPVQVHAMAEDPFFVEEGDLDAARQLVETTANVELFLYPGSEHLFADDSLPGYDPTSAALLMGRALDFLAGLAPARPEGGSQLPAG